jgi:glycosyltransferase involved in cell wall biosynthesis
LSPSPVLLLTPRYPPQDSADRSGLTAYARNAAAALRSAGAQVEILAFAETDPSLPARTEEDGLVIHRTSLGWVRVASRLVPNLVSGHRLLGAVRHVLAGRTFLAVEVPNMEGVGWAVARALPEGWLRMHTPHWDGFATGDRPRTHHDRFVRRLDRYTARRMAHLITHSEAHATAMRLEYGIDGRTIHVVPHGVPDPGVARRDRVRPVGILAIGPLEPRKGTDLLIEAFLCLAPVHPDATLTLVGAAEDATIGARLDQLAATAPDLRARIRDVGRLPEEALHLEWDRAGIVVAASRYESFGLVAAEAMARGIPTVVSSTPALVEVVAGAGRIFENGDASSLRAALGALLADAGERARLGAEGRARYTARFGIEAMGRGMLAAFASGTSERRPDRGLVLANPNEECQSETLPTLQE